MSSISFIVPTFNRAHFLGEALSAIAAQMRVCDDLLVIDDGSTDGTAEVVAAAGERVRYLRQDNAGKAVALNRGLAETNGELVWICDDDDVLRPGAVERAAAGLAEHRVGFIFGRYTRFRDPEDGTREDFGTGYWPDLTSGALARHILEDAFVMQNASLVRRECYQRVGPFSEAMPRSLDYEMFMRLAVAFPCRYLDEMMFDQRKHEGPRGPARALHEAGAVDSVWRDCDRLIFENMRRHVPIAFFESLFDGDDAHCRRAGLLQRACIEARHDCWPDALDDLAAAARITLGERLDPGEEVICRRMLSGKHGIGCGADKPAIEALLALLKGGGAGRGIVLAMLDGVLWRVRRGEPAERETASRLIRQVLGKTGIMRLIARRLRRTGAGSVTERVEPAYLDPAWVPPVGVER